MRDCDEGVVAWARELQGKAEEGLGANFHCQPDWFWKHLGYLLLGALVRI